MNIQLINKFICGIHRYGLFRTISGIIALIKLKITNPKEFCISTISNGTKIYFNYPSQSVYTLIVYRELAQSEYKFLRQILIKDSIFFDVGGGIGTYSIFAAKLIDNPIHTFEPIEENIRTIKKNLKANFVESKVQLNPMALSNKKGFGYMFRTGKTLFNSELKGISTKYSDDSIKVTTLDSYCTQQDIKHIDILKLDVEDHSPEVIEGAKELLDKKKIKIIIIELHSFSFPYIEFYNSLTHKGFECFYYDYENNSLKRVFPISEKSLIKLRPSPFNRNIIFIQHKMISKLSHKFNIKFS